ncbi:unnamed protein product [Adineta steineri]|uniref:Uncharacterized protein n=2 Tax=Adineta steineri TaxID=433720 RepID=A0A820CWY6_9BILA|nr:unnamed protein product [Adineta steineri]
MNTFGYIYNNSFNASVPSQNMIAFNYEDIDDSQFSFNLFINAITKYILVATTYDSNTIGAFSIISNGIGPVQFVIQQ